MPPPTSDAKVLTKCQAHPRLVRRNRTRCSGRKYFIRQYLYETAASTKAHAQTRTVSRTERRTRGIQYYFVSSVQLCVPLRHTHGRPIDTTLTKHRGLSLSTDLRRKTTLVFQHSVIRRSQEDDVQKLSPEAIGASDLNSSRRNLRQGALYDSFR